VNTSTSPAPAAHLSPRREVWLLLTLAGIQFTHILDFMIMMPLGPQFTALFGISDAQFGLLVSAYTLAAGASGLVASTYIDRFGRKRLLLLLYVLFGLSTLACGLATSYSTLMAARIAAGIFGGVMSALSQTIVGDVIPFERRGRAMGIVMTSFSVSTVAGVPLGLFIAAHLGWHAAFFGIALLCAVFALFAALTLPALAHHLNATDRPSALGGIAQVLVDRNHQKAFVFTALTMAAAFLVIPYITIYMQTNAGLRADQVPWVYLCGGAFTLFTARLFGRMTDRRGKVATYRLLALAFLPPMLATTLVRGGLCGRPHHQPRRGRPGAALLGVCRGGLHLQPGSRLGGWQIDPPRCSAVPGRSGSSAKRLVFSSTWRGTAKGCNLLQCHMRKRIAFSCMGAHSEFTHRPENQINPIRATRHPSATFPRLPAFLARQFPTP
jgi:predicted MFS family arabinose efflux permease